MGRYVGACLVAVTVVGCTTPTSGTSATITGSLADAVADGGAPDGGTPGADVAAGDSGASSGTDVAGDANAEVPQRPPSGWVTWGDALDGALHVWVIDATTGEPLPNALVAIKGQVTSTDSDGLAVLDTAEAPMDATVTHPGFEGRSILGFDAQSLQVALWPLWACVGDADGCPPPSSLTVLIEDTYKGPADNAPSYKCGTSLLSDLEPEGDDDASTTWSGLVMPGEMLVYCWAGTYTDPYTFVPERLGVARNVKVEAYGISKTTTVTIEHIINRPLTVRLNKTGTLSDDDAALSETVHVTLQLPEGRISVPSEVVSQEAPGEWTVMLPDVLGETLYDVELEIYGHFSNPYQVGGSSWSRVTLSTEVFEEMPEVELGPFLAIPKLDPGWESGVVSWTASSGDVAPAFVQARVTVEGECATAMLCDPVTFERSSRTPYSEAFHWLAYGAPDTVGLVIPPLPEGKVLLSIRTGLSVDAFDIDGFKIWEVDTDAWQSGTLVIESWSLP